VQNLPHTLLWQIYGTTEASFFPVLVPPPSHWPYLEFHPLLPPALSPIPNTSDYELVIHPNPNPSYSWSTPVFTIFPELNEWRTGDLFKRCPDPGCEKLYLYDSRLDDLLLLNNALKVNPLYIETALQSHPPLNAALVIGEGKGFCGLLIEPKSFGEEEALVENIWEAVEGINKDLPVHARVHREAIVVVKKGKPFVRAGKGTVVRGQTVELYREEIEDIY
jgi:acyl-CoA synthetase (AMP-forming)/AMP-acid ligase II